MTMYDEYYDEYRCCEICGRTGTSRVPLHRHHVFGGSNRKISDKLGMVVDLCCECHEVKARSKERAKELARQRCPSWWVVRECSIVAG